MTRRIPTLFRLATIFRLFFAMMGGLASLRLLQWRYEWASFKAHLAYDAWCARAADALTGQETRIQARHCLWAALACACVCASPLPTLTPFAPLSTSAMAPVQQRNATSALSAPPMSYSYALVEPSAQPASWTPPPRLPPHEGIGTAPARAVAAIPPPQAHPYIGLTEANAADAWPLDHEALDLSGEEADPFRILAAAACALFLSASMRLYFHMAINLKNPHRIFDLARAAERSEQHKKKAVVAFERCAKKTRRISNALAPKSSPLVATSFLGASLYAIWQVSLRALRRPRD
jgi:hypothetical protein